MRLRPLSFVLLLAGCSSQLLSPPAPRQYADNTPIPPPGTRSPSLAVEIIDKTFARPFEQLLDLPHTTRRIIGRPYEAQNVDAFDGVPNSTWFTNRLGQHAMSAQQVAIGPVTSGPDTTGPWTVIGYKSTGVTPGMTIIDRHGDGFVIKIDPPDYVGLASGADVIGSRLLHAAGYNVPENTIAWLDPSRLRLDPSARLAVASPDSRDPVDEQPLTEAGLHRRLQQFMPPGEQRIRVVASRFLAGKLLGPFTYTGTRSDDANDIIRHEHRRELRGLYVIASWMNHADMKAENSLDVYDTASQHVVHYLLDFGASMGSNSVAPSNPRRGVANSFDLGDAVERWATLGLRVHPYERHPGTITHPSVGYLSNDLFHPARWKPMYPAAPFDLLTDRDAFWGARIVTAFTDAHIRAAVGAAQFGDPAADRALVEFLIERRDRIGQYWFDRLNPLDRFQVVGQDLRFSDLAVDRGFASGAGTEYQASVLGDDGSPIGQFTSTEPGLLLEGAWPDQIIVDVEPRRQQQRWPPVRLYLRRETAGWELLGLRRL